MKQALLSFLENATQPYLAHVKERLPCHINLPCAIQASWTLTPHTDFYLLTMTLKGEVNIVCQRCAEPFSLPFLHDFQIAIFKKEEYLKQHINKYDCVLMNELPDNLLELITDELFLSVPEKHENCQLDI